MTQDTQDQLRFQRMRDSITTNLSQFWIDNPGQKVMESDHDRFFNLLAMGLWEDNGVLYEVKATFKKVPDFDEYLMNEENRIQRLKPLCKKVVIKDVLI